MVDTILLVIALVCLAAAALRLKASVELGWLGLFFFALRGLV